MLLKVVIAIVSLVVLISLSRLLNRLLTDFARNKQVPILRVHFIRKVINTGLIILSVIVSCFILGLGYHQVFIFLSSVLAVIGIALFAQWSILSHLTAGLIIFFAFPYRVGDRVKVIDADEDITGEIIEIASFHVLIRRQDGSTVTYPNSALLQKPVIKISSESGPVIAKTANQKIEAPIQESPKTEG